jgi:uncharacterized protein YaaQ
MHIIKTMKLILAVVQDMDADPAVAALNEAGYKVTKVASTGGFFHKGNATLMCGIKDSEIDAVLEILRKVCRQRTHVLPLNVAPGEPMVAPGAFTEVPVGGAAVFIVNVERFEQI